MRPVLRKQSTNTNRCRHTLRLAVSYTGEARDFVIRRFSEVDVLYSYYQNEWKMLLVAVCSDGPCVVLCPRIRLGMF